MGRTRRRRHGRWYDLPGATRRVLRAERSRDLAAQLRADAADTTDKTTLPAGDGGDRETP